MFNSQTPKGIEEDSESLFVSGKTDNRAPVVLIVEDDPDSRFMLRFMLEMWKYQVVEAKDGEEAIGIAEQMNPDLILMDVKLPCIDGFAAVRRIRQHPALGNVPIIFLSGYPQSLMSYEAMSVGKSDYFVKPISANELEHTVGKYFGR